MRILAKKAFRFEVGLDSYQCIPGKIQDMDDKFSKSLLFKLAQAEKSIEVIETTAQQKQIENDPDAVKPGKKPPKNAPKNTEGETSSDGGDAE